MVRRAGVERRNVARIGQKALQSYSSSHACWRNPSLRFFANSLDFPYP